jgi:thiamine pyrophosphate-dependent acetolactate synthase large subunit-like protein
VVARAFGHAAHTVNSASELRAALDAALATSGLSVIVAKVPSRSENVEIHDSLNSDVASLLAENSA